MRVSSVMRSDCIVSSVMGSDCIVDVSESVFCDGVRWGIAYLMLIMHA